MEIIKNQNGNMLQRLSCNSWFKPSCFSKMKEVDQIVLWKVLFTSIKGHLCLRKGHSDNAEGHMSNPP